MSRPAAQSATAVMMAPDCAMKASLPALGMRWAKVALKPVLGIITPKQLGPMMRMRLG